MHEIILSLYAEKDVSDTLKWCKARVKRIGKKLSVLLSSQFHAIPRPFPELTRSSEEA